MGRQSSSSSSSSLSTRTTTSRGGVAAMMFGFAMGVTASSVSVIGMYLWYYSSNSRRISRRNDPNQKDRSATTTGTTGSGAHNDIADTDANAAATATASVSFLSDMIAALWEQINAVAVTKIQSTCQPIFDQIKTYPFQQLHFTHISLGHVPLRLDHVRVTANGCRINPVTKQKYIQIKLDVIWDGQCDIQLKCGLGPFGIKAIQFRGQLLIDCQPLVDTTTMISAIQYSFINVPELTIDDFTGIAQIADLQSIKTTIQAAIVESLVDMMVLPTRTVMRMSNTENVPFMDIYQPPIGLARIVLLKGYGFVKNESPAQSSVSSSVSDTESAITTGTNTSTTRGITKLFHDVPDIYCTISIGGGGSGDNESQWSSSVIRNTNHPNWTTEYPHNCSEFIVYDPDQLITITCYDHNVDDHVLGLKSDSILGTAKVTISELLFHSVHSIPLQRHVSDRTSDSSTTTFTGAYIDVQCDLFPFVPDIVYMEQPPQGQTPTAAITVEKDTTVATATTATATTTSVVVFNPPDEPDAICGLLTILISQAHDLPIAEQTSYDGDTSYVMITFGTVIEPRIAKSVTNGVHPTYDHEFHIPMTYQMIHDAQYNISQLPSIVLSIMDGEPPKQIDVTDPNVTNQKYGSIEVSCADIAQSHDCIVTGRQPLIGGSNSRGSHNAKLEFLCSLQGVAKTTTTTTTDPSSSSSSDTVSGSSADLSSSSSQLIKVTIVKGWGFQIEKYKLKLDDVPDLYCTIQLGSNPTVWTTSTIKNSATPVWNESHTFYVSNDIAVSSIVLRITAYDSDTGKFDTDDEIGAINIPLTKVFAAPSNTYDCELVHRGSTPTNAFVTVQCERVVVSR